MVAHVFPARYRPAQKTDSLGESGSHSSLHSTPEQAMAAQSQHHQQYIGEPPPPPPLPPPLHPPRHRACWEGSGATQHLWGGFRHQQHLKGYFRQLSCHLFKFE